MKKMSRKNLGYAVAVMAGLAVLAAGCGGSGGSTPPPVAPVGPVGVIGGGAGCMQISPYGAPMAPITIGFSSVNSVMSNNEFAAGTIPSGGTYGQVTIGGGVAGGTVYQYQSMTGNAMTLSIQNPGNIGGNTQGPITASGTITLTGQQQSAIAYTWYQTYGASQLYGQNFGPSVYPNYQPGTYPNNGYPYGYQQTPCVSISGIAIDTGFNTSNGQLFNDYVYLYLNGTNHGVALAPL